MSRTIALTAKAFAALVRKETLHVARDPRMLVVALLIPIVQMLLFGFAISMEVQDVRVAVAWQKYGNGVRQQIERLRANPYTTVVGSIGVDDAWATLRSGEADAVVVFKDADEVQIIADASNPVIAQTGEAYLQAILSGAGPQANSLATTRFLYNPQLKSAYNFVPGIMGMIFLLVCALMTAVSIVREKETGTMELLLVSPARPWQIIAGKMVPFFLLSCLDLAIILLISIYVLDVPLSGGIFSAVAVTLLYIVLSLGFGLLVSTIARSQVAAMLICGMVMIIPVVMLSGLIFPIDNLPVVLKQISAIVPARWYIEAMRKLMIEGLALANVAIDVAVLAAMAAVIFAVSIAKFKDRLQ